MESIIIKLSEKEFCFPETVVLMMIINEEWVWLNVPVSTNHTPGIHHAFGCQSPRLQLLLQK